MAIRRDITNEYDDVITGAYSRITQFNFKNRATGEYEYFVSTWKSKAAFNNGKRPFADLNEKFEALETDLTSQNINGLYDHLMRHPRYSGGTRIPD